MSEPTTKAGRQMLADVRASALPGSLSHDANIVYVLAIEAEAVQNERERITAAVDGLPEVHGTGTMYVGVVYVERDEVKQIVSGDAAERMGRA